MKVFSVLFKENFALQKFRNCFIEFSVNANPIYIFKIKIKAATY